MFARFPFALGRFARGRLTVERARAIIRERLVHRSERLLNMLEQSIYANPASPYRKLLLAAGYDFADLEELIQARGVEEALTDLRNAGVYVTFDEFKGRKPIVRGSLEIPVTARSFDNPHARRDFTVETGGSTGLPTLVGQDLDHIASGAPFQMLALDAHDLLDVPTSHWMHILPGTGFRFLLQRAYMSQWSQHWYSSMGWRDTKGWPKYDAATAFMVASARAAGLAIPFPEIVRLDEAIVIVKWIRDTLDKHSRCLVATNVSHAMRICVAAMNAGIDIKGVAFRVGGEPLTPAKAALMSNAGALVVTGYGMVEISAVGLACAHAQDRGDLHFAKDMLALITHPHEIEGTGATVNAFNLTTLTDTVGKVMLNVEVDDYGIVEHRSCGCALGALGLDVHLRDIRSYSKLVGEGVTLVGNEMLHILEHALPSRFGGTALDYQLAEEEDEQRLTRLSLLISPRVKIESESEVIEFLHQSLRASSPAAGAASAVWKQAGTIRVQRTEPVWTGRGKLLPLHIGRSSAR
jgi:hypothetical protein